MTELKVNLQGSWKRILAMITVAAMCFTVIYVSPVSAAADANGVDCVTAADATPAVAIDPATVTVKEKATTQLTAVLTTASVTSVEAENVSWESADPDIASVDKGVVTGVKEGNTDIIVGVTAAETYVTASAAVKVEKDVVPPSTGDKEEPPTQTPSATTPTTNAPTVAPTTQAPKPATVTLNAKKLTMKKGTSTKALKVKKASVKGDKIKAVKTSNKKVVAVSKKGQTITLKAKKTGKATITVTMNSGAKATVKVTVNNKKVTMKKITLNKKTAKVKKGKKLTLTVTRNPINATEKITWKSSNKKIATVKNGKVTVKKNAKAGKKVTITAKTTNGKKATCKITVTK